MPSYRLADQDPIPEEVEAMDRYILGDTRDEQSGLISSCETATEILNSLRQSPRSFELIWCRFVAVDHGMEDRGPAEAQGDLLGFDLAGVPGDYWSIVADLPEDGPIARFGEQLNENGLFKTADRARAYLKEYQRLKLHDYDSPFQVIEVRRVTPTAAGSEGD